MKTYNERTQDVLSKITAKKKQRRIRAGVACACIAALMIVLFVPIDFVTLNTWQYRHSPYYDLICKVEAATGQKTQSLFDTLDWDALNAKGEAVPEPGAPNMAPGAAIPEDEGTDIGEYVETTDNQVAGVIEGDLIKRTDRYIFYLEHTRLTAYAIGEEEGTCIGDYKVTFDDKAQVSHYTAQTRQMFLSTDATTVTLVLSGYGNVLREDKKENFLCLVSVDVTDPGNMRETGRLYLTGSHQSSRLVDGMLMVISGHVVYRNEIDYSDETTFVPMYGIPGEMTCIPGGSVVATEEMTSLSYSVVTLVDMKTLELSDTAAFAGYSGINYVTGDTIFATHGYTQDRSTKERIHTVSMTEIAAMSYANGKLELLGSAHVEGSVKDQYSMDKKDGLLRVVTSTLERTAYTDSNGMTDLSMPTGRFQNANLYCIDLSDWSVAGKVIGFAPEGETVESVRFDGDTAYVCTAVVVTLTDPVYFFDLSDPENITWKDTGTIDGYSSSLVNFENGNLLGIGYGESRGLKIEMYRETENGVEGFACYEQPEWTMATTYKAYFIDRENQIIGIPVYDTVEGTNSYLLLSFDGMVFHELGVFRMTTNAWLNDTRGLVIDGVAYLFDSGFYKYKLW